MPTAQRARKNNAAAADVLSAVLKVSQQQQAAELRDEEVETAMAKIVQDTDEDTLLSALSDSLVEAPQRSDSSRTSFLRLILLGCNRAVSKHLLRKRVMECSLQHLMREDVIDNQVATEVVQVLREELTMRLAAFTTADIVQLIRQCQDEIRENQEKFSPRFLEFLTTLLSTIHDREVVVLESDDGIEEELSGPEYRAKYIEVLCRISWNPSNATALCKMLKDVADEAPLTSTEYAQVMKKLCSSLEKLQPQEVPPLVYQMLKLSWNGSSISMMKTLAHYFGNRLKDAEDDSEDMIGSDNNIRASMQAEGTVMFHLCGAARMGHPVGKDAVKIVKSGAHAPELVLDHFDLFLALALSSVKTHRQTLVDGLKAVLVRSVVVSLRRCQDGWFREAISALPDAFAILERLFAQASQFGSWNLIGDGVLDLGTSLLDSSPGLGKPDRKLKKIWTTGSQILLRILKHSSQSIKPVVEVLSSRIISSQAAPQYTECLRLLVLDSQSLFMENATLLGDLVEQVCSMNVAGAKRVLLALMPIVKTIRSFRDSVILALRKALFARSAETKQIGVVGVLQLLQIFKISSSLHVTQMSQSSSQLSNVAGDVYKGVATPSESLCNELMGVLRRGLSQSAQVRLKIYHGLYDVVAKNPALCNCCLDVLYEHAVRQEWHKMGDDVGNQNGLINLDKQILEEDGNSVLIDPVGWYIHCAQQLVTRSELLYPSEDFDSDDTDLSTRNKLADLLNAWAKKYASADLLDLDFEKNASYSSNTLEGQKNAIKVETTKNIYESLMEFTITHGVGVFEETAQLLLNLYKRHSDVAALLKSSGGAKGAVGEGGGNKRGKKKAADEAGKAPNPKKDKQAVKKAPAFKTPETAFTFRGLSVIIRTILIDTNPSAQSGLVILRNNSDFMHFVLRMLCDKQTQLDKYLSSFGGDDANSELLLKHVSSIAGDLVEWVLEDGPVAREVADCGGLKVAACEALLHNLELVTAHFPKKKEDHYIRLIAKEKTSANTKVAYSFLADKVIARIAVILSQLDDEDGDEDGDQTCNKQLGSLIRVLTFIVKQVSFLDPGDITVRKKIYEWAQRHEKSSSVANSHVLKSYMELLCDSSRSALTDPTTHLNLARELHIKLGNLDTSENKRKDNHSSFISAENGDPVLSFICVALEKSLESIDIALANYRHVDADENLRLREAQICRLFARNVNTLIELSQSAFSLESLLDYLVRTLVKLYASLGNLTKYFFVRTKCCKDTVVTSKFDKVVDVVGKYLSPNSYELISHIERKHKEMDDNTEEGKKRSKLAASRSRVLKEGKAIPNLIFKIEQFENDLIKLESRCKLDLLQKIKSSTARDFRLIPNELPSNGSRSNNDEEDSIADDDDDDDSSSTGQGDPNAESTRVGSQLNSQHAAATRGPLSQISSQASVMRGGNLEPPSKKVKLPFRKNK